MLVGTGRPVTVKGEWEREGQHPPPPFGDILSAKSPSQLATLATWPGRCGQRKSVVGVQEQRRLTLFRYVCMGNVRAGYLVGFGRHWRLGRFPIFL